MKQFKSSSIITPVILCIFLCGCNSSDTDTDSDAQVISSDNTNTNENANAVLDLSNTVWTIDCRFIMAGHPTTGGDAYQETFLTFHASENNYTVRVNVFEHDNPGCSGGATTNFSSNYSYILGEEIITTSNKVAFKIDSTLVTESTRKTWDANLFDIIYRDNAKLYFGLDANDTGLGLESYRPDTLDFALPLNLL